MELNYMNIEDLKKVTDTFINEQLNGRFKEFVSDKFIKVYLETWVIRHVINSKKSLGNAAYAAASQLFEYYLESGCDAQCNGHHVAQSFAKHFEEKVFKNPFS